MIRGDSFSILYFYLDMVVVCFLFRQNFCIERAESGFADVRQKKAGRGGLSVRKRGYCHGQACIFLQTDSSLLHIVAADFKVF